MREIHRRMKYIGCDKCNRLLAYKREKKVCTNPGRQINRASKFFNAEPRNMRYLPEFWNIYVLLMYYQKMPCM